MNDLLIDGMSLDTRRELSDLLKKCGGTEAKDADKKALQRILDDHPNAWRAVGDLVEQNFEKVIASPSWGVSMKKITRSSLAGRRAELGYNDSPMLEQMLIDTVLLAWLRLQEWEYHYTVMNEGGGMTLTKAAFWERRLSAAQTRYLRAIETLAKVRKLARRDPALQLNITAQGGQSVNVAGDLVPSKKEAEQ